jgi:ABC-type phosphate/phosphonate transport system substrate-binding protein
MVGLSLTFYLGSSLVPVAGRVAAVIGERLAIPVDFDRDASDIKRRADLDQPPAGLLWLCGLETVVRQQDGRLDATIVGAPIFPGRTEPVYDSVIVAGETWPASRMQDLGGATLAINEPGSWSGYHALRAHLAAAGLRGSLFGRVVMTGSHEASIDALLDGVADCAAIDETVWVARVARDARTATLRVIDRTDPWPSPPFSLTRGFDPGLAAAVRDVLPTVAVPGLPGIASASDDDYAVFREGLAASRSLAWPSP